MMTLGQQLATPCSVTSQSAIEYFRFQGFLKLSGTQQKHAETPQLHISHKSTSEPYGMEQKISETFGNSQWGYAVNQLILMSIDYP